VGLLDDLDGEQPVVVAGVHLEQRGGERPVTEREGDRRRA
jgi:hypothetical protein